MQLYYDTSKNRSPKANLQLTVDTLFADTTIKSEIGAKNGDLLRIPLLKDVFERYPTTPINIDIKENNDELIKQVQTFQAETIHPFMLILRARCPT